MATPINPPTTEINASIKAIVLTPAVEPLMQGTGSGSSATIPTTGHAYPNK